jgi:class 3 adenylate cyclase
MRGDEALTVFESARQAIAPQSTSRASSRRRPEADADLPIKVGIGIDSGEAVRLPDGSFRGAALNVAARLCGRAHGGEVMISEATSRLAGRLGGLHYSDRGRVKLKNISEPVHVYKVLLRARRAASEPLDVHVLREAAPQAELAARRARRADRSGDSRRGRVRHLGQRRG